MTFLRGNNETSLMLPWVLQNVHLIYGILVIFFVHFINPHVILSKDFFCTFHKSLCNLVCP